MELIFAVLGHQVSVPAANRWTKLSPAFSRVLLMTAWCGVLPEAFAALAGVEEGEGEPGSADGPLSMEAFRAIEAGRARRAAMFLLFNSRTAWSSCWFGMPSAAR